MTADESASLASEVLAANGIAAPPGSGEFWADVTEHGTPLFAPADGGFTALVLSPEPGRLYREVAPEGVELAPLPAAAACWFATFFVPSAHRHTYWFGGEDGADQNNPVGAGPGRSIATAPDAPAQPFWPDRHPDQTGPLPAGRIRWRSAILGNRRTVRVHSVGGGGPVVILLDGDDWLFLHPAAPAFDAAYDAGVMPAATLVFVPTADREAELAASSPLWQAIREELLPELADAEPTAHIDTVIAAGQSLGGIAILRAAVQHPGLLCAAVVQSGSFWWPAPATGDPLSGPAGGEIAAELSAGADLAGLRLYLDYGTDEPLMHRHGEAVARLARAAGAAVTEMRSPSGHDRTGWRHALLRDVAAALSE